MKHLRLLIKWGTPGLGIKRWVLLMLTGLLIAALGISAGLLKLTAYPGVSETMRGINWLSILGLLMMGCLVAVLGTVRLARHLLAPYRRLQGGSVVEVITQHKRRHKGVRVVAVGGGTGLPNVLRGLKPFTSNITSVVTVADDGGSSGRLRRDLGVPPPGDLRNNIAALADDESLMTRLFQYRFTTGELEGHAFGNLFIAALAQVTRENGQHGNELAEALTEVGRVLNIQGRVLPATLDDVTLSASIKMPDSKRLITIQGESHISDSGGDVQQVRLHPAQVNAYPESVQAILDADLLVIGPGSLYTSILPNLLVPGILEAVRLTHAYKIYICNVAMQPGETQGYNVADHVLGLERHIGRGVFQCVIANNAFPEANAGVTRYVPLAPDQHEIHQRYEVRYTDLTDPERPWRHDPAKLAKAIMGLYNQERQGGRRLALTVASAS